MGLREYNNKALELAVYEAYRYVHRCLGEMYPIGSLVEFEHGNSVLVGKVVEYCRHSIGLLNVCINKKDGSGTYHKDVSPIHSRMICLNKATSKGEK